MNLIAYFGVVLALALIGVVYTVRSNKKAEKQALKDSAENACACDEVVVKPEDETIKIELAQEPKVVTPKKKSAPKKKATKKAVKGEVAISVIDAEKPKKPRKPRKTT